MDILEKTRKELVKIIDEMSWQDEAVDIVSARPLTPDEAIGSPDRDDYPILKGKETMLEASFRGCKGQAFTDQAGNYNGTLMDIINLPLKSNFERAVFIATTNAILRAQGKIDKTIHCRDKEPRECAQEFTRYISNRFGNPRIAFVGFQPGMITELSKKFELRVVDLDPDNIGKQCGEAVVEDVSHTKEIIDWGDIILATGSTSANDSIKNFIVDKPAIFYGVTVSGLAYLNDLDQFCHCGH